MLTGKWTPKVDGVDEVRAKDINDIAGAVIELEARQQFDHRAYENLPPSIASGADSTDWIGAVSHITIPLLDTEGNTLELRGVKDEAGAIVAARDCIFKQGGAWKLIKNTIRVSATGTFVLSTVSVPPGHTCCAMGSAYMRRENTNAYSNVLPVVTASPSAAKCTQINLSDCENTYFIIADEDSGIVPADTSADKLAKIKSWWISNGAELILVKPTPDTIPLHPTTCAALDQTARMLDGRAVIMGADAVAPDFEVEYAADSNYRIQRLESAIIALGGTI